MWHLSLVDPWCQCPRQGGRRAAELLGWSALATAQQRKTALSTTPWVA